MTHGHGRTVLIGNPSADVYGSDLQMVESASALVADQWRVVVAVPEDGELVDLLRARGAEVHRVLFPVLRRADASPRGLLRLGVRAVGGQRAIQREIELVDADVVYVNTVTLPWWFTAAALTRRPSICHVHEAEERDARWTRTALNAPLIVATSIVCNSDTSSASLRRTIPALGRRVTTIHNGVTGPPAPPAPWMMRQPFRVATIGRLSPRKATMSALETVARLRDRGHDVQLEVCGTVFPGYEWYEEELRDRARQPDLDGAVTFSGYVSPIWPTLAAADLLLAPSLGESFGNAVVEAQLAGRPVVATMVPGHRETVVHGRTGLLVPAEDPAAMVTAVMRIMHEPALGARLGEEGRRRAIESYSIGPYRERIVRHVSDVAAQYHPAPRASARQHIA